MMKDRLLPVFSQRSTLPLVVTLLAGTLWLTACDSYCPPANPASSADVAAVSGATGQVFRADTTHSPCLLPPEAMCPGQLPAAEPTASPGIAHMTSNIPDSASANRHSSSIATQPRQIRRNPQCQASGQVRPSPAKGPVRA